jgi:hypothetical protein
MLWPASVRVSSASHSPPILPVPVQLPSPPSRSNAFPFEGAEKRDRGAEEVVVEEALEGQFKDFKGGRLARR